MGSVDTIAQLGPPPSVSSMRQRLGRSGRRADEPSILRIYVAEPAATVRTAPQDQIHERLVQAVAMVQLLIGGFNESPHDDALHLDIRSTGSVAGCPARRFPRRRRLAGLCATGPFDGVSAADFGQLLRDLQTHSGEVLLGEEGERLVNHYDFSTAFVTSDEYRLVVGPRTLGTLPIMRPVALGDLMLFAGRRWRVADVRERERIIELRPAPRGRAPSFSGAGALVDDTVRRQMRAVYASLSSEPYLDAGARTLLTDARTTFRRLALADTPIMSWGQDVVLFPWIGDRALDTLALMLRRRGLAEAARDGVALLIPRADAAEVGRALDDILGGPPSALDLVGEVRNKIVEKHHPYLGETLLEADYASSHIDVDGALAAAAALRA